MTRPYQVSRPAPLTLAERMEQKRQAKEQRQAEKEARQEVKQTLKYAALRFNYSELDEARRDQLQLAAFEIRARLKRTVEDMLFIGRQLNEAKRILPGKFDEWIAAEFGMSRATASEFRNVADRFSENIQNLYLLPISIVRRLAAPSVPDEAVEAVLAAAASRDKALPFKDAMAIVKPFMPAKERKPKQLPPPIEPETIEVEYTVNDEHEFIFPGRARRGDEIQPVMSRALGLKLQDAVLHRILKALLTPDEQDELLVALTRALEE